MACLIQFRNKIRILINIEVHIPSKSLHYSSFFKLVNLQQVLATDWPISICPNPLVYFHKIEFKFDNVTDQVNSRVYVML